MMTSKKRIKLAQLTNARRSQEGSRRDVAEADGRCEKDEGLRDFFGGDLGLLAVMRI
jgi:hypothetical protein